ncbi:beta strand repeat-containing protein [Catenuloplanes atrovinosus]|uniref:IPT/TIG domain-containing protein n=1 Tax=Catenuloplanes atrovinosus TaxID=137266 RepID=A0AAE4CG67_9ACTN|nr:IPT/TIG domain-containing protein [Catenuloplanes atrovinosus]MDR7280395.1 hypothetical protein [Catenuloplanes atrovinosus]
MRKSQPTIGRRLLRAGIAAGAVSAVLLAAAPPAFAANVAVTLTPNSGPVTGGTTVTANATGLLTGIATAAQIDVRLTTAATCPATNVATSATNLAGLSITRISDDAVSFVTPNLGTAPNTFRVCIYGVTSGTVAVGSPLIGNASTATTAFRSYLPGTLSATTGPSAGGNQITIGATGIIGTATTVGATLTSGASCPATYTTGNTSFAATATRNSADQASVTIPAGATASGGPYRVCLYNGSTATSVLLGVGSATYQPSFPQAILSSTTGKNAGGNQITATLAGAFTGITPAVVFSSAPSCPTTYGSPGAGTVATTSSNNDTVTITVPTGVLAPGTYNVCIYGGNTAGSGQIAAGNAAYTPTLPTVTLSPESGSTATATTITATSSTTANFLLGVTTPAATLTKSACPSTYATSGTVLAATNVIRISNTKAALTVPNTVVYTPADGTTSAWNVCIYTGNTASDTLVGTSVYRVGATLTVSSISPGSGPAQGGNTVTVQGSGFTAGLTASIGGAELEDIVVAANGTSFTGTTTPRAAGNNLALTVKTDAGTKSLSSAYDYSFGITVTPNTAPSNTTVTLDVLGAGFEDLAPFGTGNAASAHVYLVRGGSGTATAYNPLETTGGSGIKTVGQIQECTSVLVISDLELLCTLDLTNSVTNTDPPTPTGNPVPNGTYTVTVVSSGVVGDATAVADVTQSLITSGSTFTVSPY